MAPYIRIFSSTHGFEQIPEIANQYGLKVVPSAWIGRNSIDNNEEISSLINVANQNSNIPFVIVGSETLLRGDISKEQLKQYLLQVKQNVSVPVATAEPWHIWFNNPDLADVVDIILVNIYPYWEGQSIDNAVPYIIEKYNQIKNRFPNKRIIISETGWPDGGQQIGSAIPSSQNQKRFILELMVKSFEQNIEFFLFEAFDEIWKRDFEGETGAHWGFYTSQRSRKYNFSSIYIKQIALETPIHENISSSNETDFFVFVPEDSNPLFIHIDKEIGWNSYIEIYKDTLTSQPIYFSENWEDIMIMVDNPEIGKYYFIKISSSLNSYGSYTLRIRKNLEVLKIGESKQDQILSKNDVLWYQIDITGNAPVFFHLDKNEKWGCNIKIYKETLNSQYLKSSYDEKDQMLMLATPEEGRYFIRISKGIEKQVDFVLTIKRSLESIIPGQIISNQQLTHLGDRKWYQLNIESFNANKKIYIRQIKSNLGFTSINIKFGTLPEFNPDISASSLGSYDVSIEQSLEGIYYIQLESLISSTIQYSISAFDEETGQQFPLNSEPQRFCLGYYDEVWFKINIPEETDNIFVIVQKLEENWTTKLIFEQEDEIIAEKESFYDTIIHIKNPISGNYKLRLKSTGSSGIAILKVLTSLPEVSLGKLFVGTIYNNDGYDWLQMEISEEFTELEFILDTIGTFSQLDVWYESFDNNENHWVATQSNNPPVRLKIQNPQPGKYYLRIHDYGRIMAESEVRDYSIFIHGFRSPIEIDNEFLYVKINRDRGCVTNLRFKKGSNKELIAPIWNSYLIDLGSDKRIGEYLKTGWSVEKMEIYDKYARFLFNHSSGFTSELSLTWSEELIEIRCKLISPESLELINILRPGGEWEKERDKWAFPSEEGIEIGNFNYPGFYSPCYPSDDSWGEPIENWIALWDEQVDEVYGYIFSENIKVKICEKIGAEQHFLLSPGVSQIIFYIVKFKGTTPYEKIRNLINLPYFIFNVDVDKLFTSPDTELNYTLSFRNAGKSDAKNLVIENILPPEVEVNPESISNNGVYDIAKGYIIWNIPFLNANSDTYSVTFSARIKKDTAEGTKVINKARIWSSEQLIPVEKSIMTLISKPVIHDFKPERGGNKGSVTVKIIGENIDPNSEVKLIGEGMEDITGILLCGAKEGKCLIVTFDLTGKKSGNYKIVITNPAGISTISDKEFIVEEGGEPKIELNIVGPEFIRPGRPRNYLLTCSNRGNVDIVFFIVLVAVPDDPRIKINFSNDFYKSMKNIDWNEFTAMVIDNGKRYYQFYSGPYLPPNTDIIQSFRLTVSDLIDPFYIDFKVIPFTHKEFMEYQMTVAEKARKIILKNSQNENLLQLARDPENWWNHWCFRLSLLGYPTNKINIKKKIFEEGEDVIQDMKREREYVYGGPSIYLKPFIHSFLVAQDIGQVSKPDVELTMEIAKDCYGSAGGFRPGGSGNKRITPVSAVDPNLKVGPAGFDEEKHFIGEGTISYIIFFENLESATASVQEIKISDQMDNNLDWSTFSFNKLSIGLKTISLPEGTKEFKTTIDLRDTGILSVVDIEGKFNSSTGLAEWIFRGRDPYTGELADILPPNKEGIIPKGEGWVSYKITPKSGIQSGTIIRNKATIDFEIDIPPAPLDTPEIINTIDNLPPFSSVLPLPEKQRSDKFVVKWSGGDNEKGSGIKDYTIYFSDNGGNFMPWLINTIEKEAEFIGEIGHTYSFYSIARDNVGNIELPPSQPDTIIKILLKGDINEDNQLDIIDVILCLRMAIGLKERDLDAGDMNDDGQIDIIDVIKLLRKSIGLP